MIAIRPVEPSDFVTITRIFHASIRQIAKSHYTEDQLAAWSPEERSPEQWQRRTADLRLNVAVVGDAVAGFIGFATSGYIDLLFTAPEFVRRGIARALLLDAEESLRTLGVDTAWADVSLAAQAFFLAIGYRIVREQTVVCRGVQLRNTRMEKMLTSSPGSTRAVESPTMAPSPC